MKKLLVPYVLASALLIPGMSHAANLSFPLKVTVEKNVGLHKGATNSYPVMDELKPGQQVTVTDEFTNSSGEVWYHIDLGTAKGWGISTSFTATSSITINGNATVTGTNVSFRKGATTAYAIAGTLANGTIVKVIDRIQNSAGEIWYRIQYGNQTGWVLSTYLTTSSAPITSQNAGQTLIVGTTNTYLYSGATTSYRQVELIPFESSVTVLGQFVNASNETWYNVKTSDGKTGWTPKSNLVSSTSNITLPVRDSLDSPATGSTITGQSVVRGWILDPNGVSKIAVLVDGKTVGNAACSIVRADILQDFPQYQNANSGYQYNLNTLNLINGTHSISINETDKSGKTHILNNITVNVQNLPAKGSIDAPVNGSTISGLSVVRGWFLDPSGVSNVEVLVDGNTIGTAQIGLLRQDVERANPAYQIANSGFSYTLDASQFANGLHTITVKETGKNGSTLTLTSKVTIADPFTGIDLRTPANITAAEINNFIAEVKPNSPLIGHGQDFINAQNKYGVNAQYLAAHAIWETGWGLSPLSIYKHNLFGYGAYDGAAFTYGYYFPTYADCINYVAYTVRGNYLDSSGSYYTNYGPTLTGMNVDYASDQNWKNGIASLMEEMKAYSASYYSQAKILPETTTFSQTFGSLIPSGQPYPSNLMINFPAGVSANIINTSSLNLRSIPYVSSSSLISTIEQGNPITVLGYDTDVTYAPNSTGNSQYHWYRVNVTDSSGNVLTGWLYGGYLNITNLLQVNNINGLPIYSSASSTVPVLGSSIIPNGTYLKAVLNSSGKPTTSNGRYEVYLPTMATPVWVPGGISIVQITQ